MQIAILIGAERPSHPTLAARLVVAWLGVAAVTILGQALAPRWGTAPVLLLYLLPVLGAAVYCGLVPALATATLATLAFNFYFVDPLRTLLIHAPADGMTLAVFFAVAVVTSRLAGSLREQSLLAAAHASRNATIAGFARRLLSCPDQTAIFEATVEELARLFGCHAVLLAGADEPTVVARSPGVDSLTPADLAAAAQAIASGRPAGRGVRGVANLADWSFHPVAAAGEPGLAAGLAREDGAPPVPSEQNALLENLLDQAALAVGRARADEEARKLARLHERDAMQAALLSSIGRDVKPGLKAIAAGARALRRAGEADRSVVAELEGEAARLDRYVDDLLDLSPEGDREPIHAGDVVIDLFKRTVSKAGEPVHLVPKEYAVLAELAKHAGRVLTHRQLLRSVWGPAQQDQVDYLRVAIRGLRQKLETDPSSPVLILNEPSVGYRLVAG